MPWQVVESGTDIGGATRLTLRMEMTTTNNSTEDFMIGEALHTYFQISDIGAVQMTGLEGCEYWDKVGGSVLKKQADAIQFSGETDRVYINTAAACVIEDKKLNRRIHIAKSGSHATIVWTPWAEKATKMCQTACKTFQIRGGNSVQ